MSQGVNGHGPQQNSGSLSLVEANAGSRPPMAAATKVNKSWNTRTILRKNRPVLASIPVDVWHNVFACCPLQFLLQARGACPEFRSALLYESFWKQTRLQQYGAEHADPPPGITEVQYADLLVGKGCQNKGCKDTKAKKTYWAFERRWCDPCLATKIIYINEATAFIEKFPLLVYCVPLAKFENRGQYKGVFDHTGPSSWRITNSSSTQLAFTRSALKQILDEHSEFMSNRSSDGETVTRAEEKVWFENKMAANVEQVTSVLAIEDSVGVSRKDIARVEAETREQRSKCYQDLASELEPPIDYATLSKMPSFIRACTIPKAPSERSWQTLLPKLQREREEAEYLSKESRQYEEYLREGRFIESSQTISDRRLRDQRIGESTHEQLCILAVAEVVINNLTAIGGMDDADFAPLIFRETYKAYQELDGEFKPGDTNEPYHLLMDDARLVYNLKIMPLIRQWRSTERSSAARKLRCPGCSRVYCGFTDVMVHIFETHAYQLGDFGYFRVPRVELPPSIPFPWYRVRWPKNLPMLRLTDRATGKWDFHNDIEYKRILPAIPQEVPVTEVSVKEVAVKSAFEGRNVCLEEGYMSPDLVNNIIYASKSLKPTEIADDLKSKIAFQYALSRYETTDLEPLNSEDLQGLQRTLMEEGFDNLFENLRCAQCCSESERGWPLRSMDKRFQTKGQSLGSLIHHYRGRHGGSNWMTKLFQFRSNAELWVELTRKENEMALDVFEKLFPRDHDDDVDPLL